MTIWQVSGKVIRTQDSKYANRPVSQSKLNAACFSITLASTLFIGFFRYRRLGDHRSDLRFTLPERFACLFMNDARQFIALRFNLLNETMHIGLSFREAQTTPVRKCPTGRCHCQGNLFRPGSGPPP